MQVSTDPNFTTLVNDTNAVLFPGSQDCNRASSAVLGNHVTFVAGTRTSAKATDGLFYSLALEANRLHYFRVISQGINFVSCDPNFNCIQTKNPPFGNTFPEPAPFNAAAPFNYAFPTIRPGIDRNRWVNDPLTGVPVSLLSAPVPVNNNGAITTNAPGVKGFDAANNGNWSTVNSAAVIDNTLATNTGANQDPVFIRLTPWCVGGATLSPPLEQQWHARRGRAHGQNQASTKSTSTRLTIFKCSSPCRAPAVQPKHNSRSPWTESIRRPIGRRQVSQGRSPRSCSRPLARPAGGVITNPGIPSHAVRDRRERYSLWILVRKSGIESPLSPGYATAYPGRSPVDGSGNVTWQTGEKFRMSSVSVGSFLTLVVGGVNTDFLGSRR